MTQIESRKVIEEKFSLQFFHLLDLDLLAVETLRYLLGMIVGNFNKGLQDLAKPFMKIFHLPSLFFIHSAFEFGPVMFDSKEFFVYILEFSIIDSKVICFRVDYAGIAGKDSVVKIRQILETGQH